MYALAFAFEELPLAFPLLGPAMWFGLRFPHPGRRWPTRRWSGAVTVAADARRRRTLRPRRAPDVGALLAQFYVIAIVVTTALRLSTGRDERDALGAELRRTEAEAVYEASVRDAIIGSMAEGLLVVDDGGVSSWSATRRRATLLGAAVGPGDAGRVPAQRVDGTPLRDAERPLARALRGESVRDLELGPRCDARPPHPRGLRGPAAAGPAPGPRPGTRAVPRRHLEHAHREELSAFAGVVAHDLRNPLAAIDGWTEMIADELEAGELDPDLAHEFVSRVRSSSARMHALIGDLLDHATERRAGPPARARRRGGAGRRGGRAPGTRREVDCGPIPAVAATRSCCARSSTTCSATR